MNFGLFITTSFKGDMIKIARYFFGLLLISSFTFVKENEGSFNKNMAFSEGEVLTYRVMVGWLNAADARMEISPEIHTINNRPTYKIDVYGKTLSVFDFFTKVRDHWGTYVDTTTMLPHRSYRYIEEGRYRKNEIVDFDRKNKVAIVSKLDKQTKALREKKTYPIDPSMQDIVSGYYYLRTLEFKNRKAGEVIKIKGFFNEEEYNLEMIFEGRESLKTNIGDIQTLVFSPILPKNKLFDGEKPIKIWLSDDLNKIPLKIKAKMFVGSIDIDIKSATGLRNGLDLTF